VVTTRAVDPRLQTIAARLAERLPVALLEPEPLVAADLEPPGAGEQAASGVGTLPDLRRFSRYWRWAEPRIWGLARPNGGMGS
jgi:deoxyribodipyrimidine photo-lyase